MAENFPIIIPGAEPFFFKGNSTGILISHGYAGTPQSVRFLGEYISSKGYTVYGIRLDGHGTDYIDMEHCNYQDWIKNLEEGYQLLKQFCTEIFIIGQSMGGTLTLNLASEFPDIKGIILINAAISTIPIMNEYKSKQHPQFIEEGQPDIKAKNANEITYTKTPLRSIKQLLSLMDHTRNKLHSIHCPTLAFRSNEDHVVPPENTDYIINHIHSEVKETIRLCNSYHVASLDNDKEFIAEQSCLFLEKHSAKGKTDQSDIATPVSSSTQGPIIKN
ncbi:alpha/beta hydrolase [Neobacillus terrae]|uniref:alpha/beta hydrolase n=1 Tax=Neobacillus terrae TaxID=3034837 RepID=UPI00140E625E|nr:alpha/beta fold hydrolase [Neobacillus terrae]NHM30732.1 alpha/beta fold hydrolase [Neobacillus terrae]